MSDARRFLIAGLVTLAMPVLVIGAPALADAAHVGGADTQTHHIYPKGPR